MTLEQLLGFSAEQASKLSQKELEDFFAPMLDITRPDRPSAIHKGDSSSNAKHTRMSKAQAFQLNLGDDKKAKLDNLLKDMDIDLEDLL